MTRKLSIKALFYLLLFVGTAGILFILHNSEHAYTNYIKIPYINISTCGYSWNNCVLPIVKSMITDGGDSGRVEKKEIPTKKTLIPNQKTTSKPTFTELITTKKIFTTLRTTSKTKTHKQSSSRNTTPTEEQ